MLAHYKTPTTPDTTDGITAAISEVLKSAKLEPDQVSSVAIGTTHFINAVVERDARRLRRVAILRVSKSYARAPAPFAEWPADLARILYGYVSHVDGGLKIDGAEEAPINEAQIVEEARKIKELGLSTVVVCGVFSPIDEEFKQEDRIRDILLKELPGVDIIASHTVANIGFLERENASILNAAILPYARRTIRSFKASIKKLGLTCPLYITQNDGTVLSASAAADLPIRTFLSGPTNSMRGAAFLSGLDLKDEAKGAMVIDIGGTTADIGVLTQSGMPRQAAAYVKIDGVEVNYSMPHLHSIGLGGGSLVREEQGEVVIGPQSVGSQLTTSALVFGGDKLSATDIAVAAGTTTVGDASKVARLDPHLVTEARSRMKQMLERAVDVMKLSPEDVPVLLVGGGAILAPDDLNGASRLVKPPFYDVANAVGAAISRVCGFVDMIQSTTDKTVQEAVDHAKTLAIERVVAAGAVESTVQIAEVEHMPVSYVEGRLRTVVRAVGDLKISASEAANDQEVADEVDEGHATEAGQLNLDKDLPAFSEPNIQDPSTYRPNIIINGFGVAEWIVSETDLQYLADGAYVLGCAGGGSPRGPKIQLTDSIREGNVMKITDASSLKPDDVIVGGGGLGSPAVGVERLAWRSEITDAIKLLNKFMNIKAGHAIMPIEIGGANGLAPLGIGASNNLNIPVVDADWMGRAYPTAWQTTLCAHDPGNLTPCAVNGGDGNTIIMPSSSNDKMVDEILRAACVSMGLAVGAATKPHTAKQVQDFSVLNTVSLAWRIGRSIAQSTINNSLSTVAETIIDEVGGPDSAKVLFRGKIIEVENRLYKGHNHGVVHVKAFKDDDDDDSNSVGSGKRMTAVAQGGVLKIPFKNENIYVEHTQEDGTDKIIASVPDLIAILDNGSGRALGVPEFKYGYRVTVIGITASPQWTRTKQALEIGGPKAFGFDHEYVPLGRYVAPKSVIEEYRPR